MTGQPFGIDHLMIRVPDSEAAGRLFETLGFAVTPRSTLPGLSNRLVCFEPDDSRGASFIELISIDDPAAAPEPVIDLLGPENGPAAIVVATENAARLAAELSGRAGIQPARDLTRSWQVAGELLQLSFSVLIAHRGSAPLGWSAIQHRTPEHYRRSEFLRHTDRGLRLSAILACAPEPVQAAREMSSLWSGRLEPGPASSARVVLGRSELRVGPLTEQLRQKGTRARIMGIALSTTDPDPVCDRLVAHPDLVSRLGPRRFLIGVDDWTCWMEIEVH